MSTGRPTLPSRRRAWSAWTITLACRSYLVGDKRFPSANVDEHDLRRVLAPAFSPRVHVRHLHGHDAQGYSRVVLADVQRSRAAA